MTGKWAKMLSSGDEFLGIVKKVTEYGAFVSLPAGADGLLHFENGQCKIVEGDRVLVVLVDMPVGKPIVLRHLLD